MFLVPHILAALIQDLVAPNVCCHNFI